jgi:4-coumarate--CoA ligase
MYAAGLLSSSIDEQSQYMLGLLPFFHIMATKQFHVSIFMGSAIVILPRFEPETLLRVVEKYKMRKLALAPPLVTFMAKDPIIDKYDLTHVKFLNSGGAPLGKEVIHAVYRRIGARVLQGYGMTEFAAGVTYSTTTHFRDGASGRLLPNVQMKVKDIETDADLPPNQPGELLFKTPTQMSGYFNNPEANAKTFTADGFIRTGDIGYIDDDGYVFIIDRLKELIKYKGHQVAPAEVEDVVNSHPEVTESCCVRGVDPASGEEIPKAFVVRKAGSSLTEQALMEYVAGMVTGYKRVREVEFITEVPKSLSGKILRKQLQAVQNDKVKAQLVSRSRL